MRVYFLDKCLDNAEVSTVTELMAQFEGPKARRGLVQVQIPMVLPLPSTAGVLSLPIERQIDMLCRNLINAGIDRDEGVQVLFVMPRDTHWGVKLQTAIMELTGFAPYVIQRHIDEDGRTIGLRILDGHALLGGKNDGTQLP